MKSTMKKFVLLMAVLVCVAMLSSVLFMGFSAGHDCTHEDCAICYHISVCMNMLKSFALVILILAIVMAARSVALCAAFEAQPYFAQPTLISNKVKLSN